MDKPPPTPILTLDEEQALIRLVRDSADRGFNYYNMRHREARTHEERAKTAWRLQQYVALQLIAADLAMH